MPRINFILPFGNHMSSRHAVHIVDNIDDSTKHQPSHSVDSAMLSQPSITCISMDTSFGGTMKHQTPCPSSVLPHGESRTMQECLIPEHLNRCVREAQMMAMTHAEVQSPSSFDDLEVGSGAGNRPVPHLKPSLIVGHAPSGHSPRRRTILPVANAYFMAGS
ncbi:hypothetical protein PAXRUDRAFT_681654 [Paxillus rubicundulus Ve08.2h10]|uniref:Uncharacterized protein n=1 Tax=Paxillus rubicundulus Ve08.2h10 TaxID=930991 RepID=A0A0D0E6I9_9AGAM|nr:hypothetical protein PAXRUDRAFT_681654 [Paxillus rubicundulus Ve08.2h10]